MLWFQAQEPAKRRRAAPSQTFKGFARGDEREKSNKTSIFLLTEPAT